MTTRHLERPAARTGAGQAAIGWVRRRPGLIELGLIALLYVAYSGSRLLASDDLTDAQARAERILHWEKAVGLDGESGLGHWFAAHDVVGVLASYYYASAHYVITAVVLLVLYRRGGAHYVRARRALVIATVLGLVMYLLLPTAPPRLTGMGYVDVLAQHASAGWWGADASAPKGLGGMTNELAAMPSLHAGWALWVAIVAFACTRSVWLRVLGSAHAVITALVVVGTGNHWVSDVLVGWYVVVIAALIAWPRRTTADTAPAR
ncbi:phosphatase PAP2 family protein [Luteipulveratus sp. YIM 133132]|uniref:phosphatase PAP2 family protein n=1 Tax=Luteipulveratus flavus TaxID=3031728 RepID=UPI0023AFBB5D|nr:phosphatase PAP2 family protein [Luteipulveratus sp. YIM 133132]MDE9364360.1 phosphatase PAP2 family protein [Luteipulveratus sp. YIM 133132]